MLLIVYLILGYWAVGKTIYRNRIVFGTWQAVFFQKLALALIIGWILITIAIVCLLLGR